MTRKSKKLKTSRQITPKKLSNLLSDKQFKIGNKVISSGNLSEEIKQTLIELNKTKLFRTNQKNLLNPLIQQNGQTKIVLTQVNAVQLIKNTYQDLKPNTYKDSLYQMKKFKNCLQDNELIQKYESQVKNSLQMRDQLHKEIKKNITQFDELIITMQKKKLQQRRRIKQMFKKAALKFQKTLFVDTIFFIIELKKDIEQEQTKVIIMLEQSYPIFQTKKNMLIQLIGQSNYNNKLKACFEVYQNVLKNSEFFNPSFICCHQCMRIIPNVNIIKFSCKKISSFSNLDNLDIFSPHSYREGVIKGNYLENSPSFFLHPFLEYHIKQFDLRQKKNVFKCNRYLCQSCYFNHLKAQKIETCSYCLKFDICQCNRCLTYKKMIQMLAHFQNQGGQIRDLQENFIFKNIFTKCTRIDIKRNSKIKQYLFGHQLQEMYNKLSVEEKYANNMSIIVEKRLKNDRIAFRDIHQNVGFSELDSKMVYLKRKQFNKIEDYQRQLIKKRELQKKQRMKQKIELNIRKINDDKLIQINQGFNEEVELIFQKFHQSGIFKEKLPPEIDQQKWIMEKTQYEKRKHQILKLPFFVTNNLTDTNQFCQISQQSPQFNLQRKKEQIKRQLENSQSWIQEDRGQFNNSEFYHSPIREQNGFSSIFQ